MCGTLYSTFIISFYPYAFYNKRFQMLVIDLLDRSKAICPFNATQVSPNPQGSILSIKNLPSLTVSTLLCDGMRLSTWCIAVYSVYHCLFNNRSESQQSHPSIVNLLKKMNPVNTTLQDSQSISSIIKFKLGSS